MHRLARVALTFAVLATPAYASANGRFPQATQLAIGPTQLSARTTFGLLRSDDGGATWRWICEEVAGYSGTFDPAIALTGTGTLVVGLPDGLSRTTDGCGFVNSPALAKAWIVDVAIDRIDPHHLVAIDAPVDLAAPGFQAFVAHSRDDGATWSFAPTRLPEDMVPSTIDLAPSRPERVYASGVPAFKAFASVVRSDDGGETWAESTFDMHGARAPYIAGIDPLDPDRVWLRLDGDDHDELWLSKNGAQRFDRVLDRAELLGFAVSPDGTKIAVGGPSDGLSIAGTDLVFAKVSSVHVRCLAWSKEGLWACGDDALDGFAVGLSTDGGKTFAPRLRLRDLQPLGCVKDACAKAWANVSTQLAPQPLDAGVDASVPDAAAAETTATGAGCQSCGRRVGAPWLVIAWPMLRWRRVRRRRAPCLRAASSSP